MYKLLYIIFIWATFTFVAVGWPVQFRFRGVCEDYEDLENGGMDIHLRDLKVGKLNFLHTTDVHGWFGSHLTQNDYDGDWGDYISFISKFRENKLHNEQDLLLIDTGDKTDGNGLSDSSNPIGFNSSRIFNELDLDLLTLGNHELYRPMGTALEYYNTSLSSKFKDKYVASNVEFVDDDGNLVPFGNKYVFLKTKNTKTKILAFSFLFNFSANNPRAKVTPALEEIQNKDWFQEVLLKYPEDSIDMLLIFGHLPITDNENKEINKLHKILREHYPNIVIQYFGGHSHIRDFVSLDTKSTGIQSGRFAETVGFLSIDDIHSDGPRFFRKYIDFNKRSFAHHAGLSDPSELETEKGVNVSKIIRKLRLELNLDQTYGYVPKTYYFSARPVDSEDNIYNLLKTKILPRLYSSIYDPNVGRYIMINSGSVRYDLSKGPFTRDTEFIVLPFENEWNYLELPNWIASKIEDYLNQGSYILKLGQSAFITKALRTESKCNSKNSCPFVNLPLLTEGYTTSDEYGCKGDDTPHNSQRNYMAPNVITAKELAILFDNDKDVVHFVFYNFMQQSVLEAVNNILNDAGINDTSYTSHDSKLYGGFSTKTLLREYIQEISKL